jgi:hypothetical protein
MNPKSACSTLALGLALASGCATTQDYLDANQSAALQTAESRARFELGCPDIDASVLSRKIIDPAGPWGMWRAEYTIGVRGCGRQVVYVTVCLDHENCNAISDTGRVAESYPGGP